MGYQEINSKFRKEKDKSRLDLEKDLDLSSVQIIVLNFWQGVEHNR